MGGIPRFDLVLFLWIFQDHFPKTHFLSVTSVFSVVKKSAVPLFAQGLRLESAIVTSIECKAAVTLEHRRR